MSLPFNVVSDALVAAADHAGRPFYTLDIRLGPHTWRRLRTELGLNTGWMDSGAALILHAVHGVLRCWPPEDTIGSASPVVFGAPVDSDEETGS